MCSSKNTSKNRMFNTAQGHRSPVTAVQNGIHTAILFVNRK